ncbi:Formate dehydrogenase, mitochondrial [Candidatus Lokiarchaeum ossiferum]|uniref:Formate dehydrogenase, mitochondrial n=1 Tax=Candidatus Lokiarchaeum ossiferum TaxID=2951803 RepID=A0ABY6I1I0_9ARCH|nr:Formate dehydrogenase, mitochondrial [Candidatus Lokiarchaeum sp. B-35]
MKSKANVYLASPVFYEISQNPMVSPDLQKKIEELFNELREIAEVTISPTRFPSEKELIETVQNNTIDFIGCHISHPITSFITQIPSVKGIATSTMGFNHIHMEPGVLVTHTPSVLDKTVADFTMALILSTLRNIVPLHNGLWAGNWIPGTKWDLDDQMNHSLDNMVVGIIGMGEIGREVVKRLIPWNVQILYFDLKRDEILENQLPNLYYESNIETIFAQSDVISLHIPLNAHTKGYVNAALLKKMKPQALLVNTARGGVVNFEDLLQLLELNEIAIHLAFDVYEPEPISPEILERFHKISKQHPELRFVFIPHNASSDANTRAKMSIMMLSDLILLAKSKNLQDLAPIHLIPPQKDLLQKNAIPPSKIRNYRIFQWWE